MRQVFLEKGTLAIKEVCEPELDDHSVLVSVYYSFVSVGSGLNRIINSHQGNFNDIPTKVKKVIELVKKKGFDYTAMVVKDRLGEKISTLGHSCSGIVIATGKKVKKIRVGDLVACVGPGVANHADVVCVPENLVARVKDPDFIKESSLAGVGAIALQAVRRADLSLGETICIFGLETLGQMIGKLALLSGCKVIGIDKNYERLRLAEKLGMEVIESASEEAVEEAVKFSTSSFGSDCSIVTPDCFSEQEFEKALQVTRKKGRIVITGNTDSYIKKNLAYQKEIDILFSLSYGPGRFDESYESLGNDYPYAYVRWTENRNMQLFVDLIQDGKLDVNEFIKYEFDLAKIGDVTKSLKAKDCLGFILDYDPPKDFAYTEKKKKLFPGKSKFIPAYKDSLNVCVIGVNQHTRLKLIPTISSIENVKINSVVDKSMSSSSNAARWLGARALSGGSDLLLKGDSDVVVVGPTGELQVDDIIELLSLGKSVLATRPIVYNFDDLEKMKKLFTEKSDVFFSTAYYRSYSPFIQKIKGELIKRKSPLIANFRMNLGYIPKDQRISPQWRGGRVIAQASQAFNVFCYLTESQPLTISAEALRPNEDDSPTDNFIATIAFEDGSICSLTFTSLGDHNLGKERLELSFDFKSIVMDDYLKLEGYGLTSFNEKTKNPDLGYANFMRAFFDCARKRKKDILPISYHRLLTVAKINLTVDELICSGGGEKRL